VRSASDIHQLPIPDPELELRYVVDAVRLIRKSLQGSVPLIGFSGSPGRWQLIWLKAAAARVSKSQRFDV